MTTSADPIQKPAPPYSPFMEANGFVYTCGHIATDSEGQVVSDTFDDQAHQVFRNLQRTLATAGCAISDVVKVNAYLQNLTDAPSFNEIYRQYFGEPFPPRTTVGANLPGLLLEIEVIAHKPSND